MIRRLHRSRDGTVLVLEQDLLDEIGLEAGGEVELTLERGRLSLAPARTSAEEERRVHDALERIASDRRAVLRRLAD